MNAHSNRSGKTIIIVVIIVLVLAGSVWYLGIYKPEQEAKEKARLEQIAQAEAEQKRIEQAAQDKARYDQLIENADTEFAQENWDTARSLYQEASSLLPNQQYPKDQLALVNAKLDELAALEAKKAAGIVESVSTPTGRYYIIVSSSIDEDLAMDYAKKLAKEGNDVQIIEHDSGKNLYYRVALGDYATLEQAQGSLSSFSSYGSGVWILKY
ncbi:SPOR domain-containing protein [Ekhidna sp.]|uniref:SPOR domain-containing protein n=1 Tax=Ekhidna sp. TaxID=2608089 RepID=UPI003299B17F